MRKLILIAMIIIPLLIAGCGKKKKYVAPPPPPVTSQIEILNHHIEEEWWEYGQEWITRIKGEAKNNSGQVCSPVIAAKFFNYNNVMIEKGYDVLTDMGIGETWEFEIVYYGEQIKKYEVWVDDIW